MGRMTREEAIKHLKDIRRDMWTVDSEVDAINMAITALEQPEQKKGKWIDETFKPWGLVHHPYRCDQCGEHSECNSEYCPSCGAKMEG